MLICIPDVLSPERTRTVRSIIDAANWVDGNETSGAQAAEAKWNEQIPAASPARKAAGDIILDALYANALFLSAALPSFTLPPLFNRYSEGGEFRAHIDNAIRFHDGRRMRSDLSATLFLTEPENYDGGELTIETSYGAQSVKLNAGSMVLYPADSLHLVTPVTRGARVSAFFWIQSMIRGDSERTLLFDLDQTIQRLQVERGVADNACISLAGIYHNLIRKWAET